MRKTIITVLGFCAMLLAISSSAQAQQPAKVPRIGYVATTAPDTPNNLAFAKDCETSVMSREKTL